MTSPRERGPKKARVFFTGSVRIIGETRLSATDLRVYAAVSLHDGMSKLKGSGGGCYASNLTLAGLVGCDYTTLSKSLKRLRELGYIEKEERPNDKRMAVYRVTFPDPDSWRNDQLSTSPATHTEDAEAAATAPEIVGETANNRPEIVGDAAQDAGKIVGEREHLRHGDQTENRDHYIPLNGELDSAKQQLHPVKRRDLSSREALQGVEGKSPGELLAVWDREFKLRKSFLPLTFWRKILGHVEDLELSLPSGSTLSRQARRLGEDLHAFISDAEEDERWVNAR